MQCELCGKDANLVTALVEGTRLKVCATCGRFGKILQRAPSPAETRQKIVRAAPEPVERVVDDYAQRIKAAREKRGLTQEDFAKLIMVKESLLHKLETGQYEPPLDLARKLERILRIQLVEKREEGVTAPVAKEKRPEGLTIGDILNLKS